MFSEPVWSDASNVLGFFAFTAGPDVEFDYLTLVEGPVYLTDDVGVVNEHVTTSVTRDEAEAPFAIKKLDCALHMLSLQAGPCDQLVYNLTALWCRSNPLAEKVPLPGSGSPRAQRPRSRSRCLRRPDVARSGRGRVNPFMVRLVVGAYPVATGPGPDLHADNDPSGEADPHSHLREVGQHYVQEPAVDRAGVLVPVGEAREEAVEG